jgi:hypothetical protein
MSAKEAHAPFDAKELSAGAKKLHETPVEAPHKASKEEVGEEKSYLKSLGKPRRVPSTIFHASGSMILFVCLRTNKRMAYVPDLCLSWSSQRSCTTSTTETSELSSSRWTRARERPSSTHPAAQWSSLGSTMRGTTRTCLSPRSPRASKSVMHAGRDSWSMRRPHV